MITERIDELKKLCNTGIDINEVYNYNQTDILKRIYAYTKGIYLECGDPNAIFYNISNDRSHHFAKNIDLDTKDLMPFGVGETNYYQAWILKQKFQKWLDDEHFAIKLNDLAEKVSTYGSHIIKLTKRDGQLTWDNVDLRNIFFDPTIETIRGNDKVEIHELNEQQLKEKSEVWEFDIEEMKTNENEKYEIWEFWGYYEDEYKQVIGYGEDKDEQILFEKVAKVEDDPYYDFHLSAYEDVWLRVGVVERLFSIQEQVNRLVNFNDKNNEIASLLLLRTQSPTTEGNVLTGVESGQILTSTDLQQIQISNQYLNEFLAQLAQLGARADELCYTPQVVRGESLPSGTPFRSVAVASNNAKSSFRFIRERIGETLGYILKEKVLPGVVATWNKGEIFDLAEEQEDTLIFDEFYALFLADDFRKKKYEAGMLVEQTELETYIKNNLDKLNRQGRKIKIPNKFFDFEWGIKLNVIGESVDKAQRNGAFESILQWIQTNPAIQSNPYFRQYVEDNGITPIRLRESMVQQQPQQGQAKPIEQEADALLGAVDSQ